MDDTQEQIDKLRKDFEEFKAGMKKNEVKPYEGVKRYDELKVGKLYASLPVYTEARPDTPQQGEIWLESVSGTRSIKARIVDTSNTTYSITIT